MRCFGKWPWISGNDICRCILIGQKTVFAFWKVWRIGNEYSCNKWKSKGGTQQFTPAYGRLFKRNLQFAERLFACNRKASYCTDEYSPLPWLFFLLENHPWAMLHLRRYARDHRKAAMGWPDNLEFPFILFQSAWKTKNCNRPPAPFIVTFHVV